MGKLIKIDKIKELNFVYYYKVSTSDFESNCFYIGIDPKNGLILIFLGEDFSKPLRIIDIKKPDEQILVSEIDPRLMWPAIGQAIKAIKEKKFPKYLDYAA